MTTFLGQNVTTDLLIRNEELRKQLKEERNKNEELRKQLQNGNNENDMNEDGIDRKQKVTTSTESQTSLDMNNIDELLRARITLMRKEEEHSALQHELEKLQQQLKRQKIKLERQQQQIEHQQQQLEHKQQPHYHHQPHEVTIQPQRQHLPNFSALNSMQSITYMSDKSYENKQNVVTQLHYPNVTLPKQVTESKNLTSHEKKILEDLFDLDGTMTTILDKLRAVTDGN